MVYLRRLIRCIKVHLPFRPAKVSLSSERRINTTKSAFTFPFTFGSIKVSLSRIFHSITVFLAFTFSWIGGKWVPLKGTHLPPSYILLLFLFIIYSEVNGNSETRSTTEFLAFTFPFTFDPKKVNGFSQTRL